MIFILIDFIYKYYLNKKNNIYDNQLEEIIIYDSDISNYNYNFYDIV
jgi:hypothetical protein